MVREIDDYFGVDIETVWLTVSKKMPDVKPRLKKMLEKS